MIDFEGICEALAARFVAATLGTPTGAPAIQASYAQYPKNTPQLPAVVIEPQHGTVTANGDRWLHEMDVDAVLLLAKRPGDPARVEKQRQLYLPYLLAATEGQMKLGKGGQAGWDLAKALPIGWTWLEYDMAGESYDAVRVHFRIWVYETVSLVP